ncbi:MAG: O-succinylbenzoate synthase [Deltaproteobacteria bacterium]|nr:O-succinylbenzoate synthase [Deltaproteobacteria bacterium]
MTCVLASAALAPIGGSGCSVGNALATWQERRGLLLRVTDTDGSQGQGEASPLPGYSPDSLEDVQQTLSRVCRLLPGMSLEGEDTVAVTSLLAPFSEALRALPSARCALEVALLDLLARRRGIALEGLLGAPEARDLPLAGLLGVAGRGDLLAEAARWLSQGVTTLKVKVGADLDGALPLLQALRRAHPEACLRVDANACWSASEAPSRLRSLAPLQPELVEEPCGPERLLTLPRGDVPWAVDESLTDPRVADAAREGALGAAAVVLKPMLLGFLGAWELGLAARSRGYDVVVTHLFDGPVALASACALALAVGTAKAQGLAPHGALKLYPAASVPHLQTAVLSACSVSGHGVAL